MPASAVRTFTDPDAYYAAFGDMQAESVITGRAIFAPISRQSRSISFLFSETLPRVAYSAVDPKQFAIAFATHRSQQIHIGGHEWSPGEIIVFRAGSEGHNRFSAACEWGSIALTHQDVAAAGETVIGRELVAPRFTHPIRPPTELFTRLLRLHEATGHLATSAPEILLKTEVARAIEQTLLHAMVLCLSHGQAIEARSAHRRHAAIMRRLEEMLAANPGRTLYTAELCAATGASDRTLRACCQEHLGMSPTRYLWLRRMHLARRALRMADPEATSVTEIATNYGFWELGRFSVTYRSLFGESPSASLRWLPADVRPQKNMGSPLNFRGSARGVSKQVVAHN